MKEISISEFRNNIKTYTENVQYEDIIVLNNGKPAIRVSNPNNKNVPIFKKPYVKEDILAIAKENNVEFIRLQFADIFGFIKSITLPYAKLEDVLNNGCMFDGSSISGFARVEESDMRLVPDLDTFCILPFSENPGVVARIICDVYTTEGKPFEGDPRYILRKAIAHANELGYGVDIGPECEFFLFGLNEDESPNLKRLDSNSYFDIAPVDKGSLARRAICIALNKMGFEVEASHHESAPCQHEIDFRYCEALEAADKIMTCKMVIKAIARENNLHATFMPKPIYGVAGNGMHINLSLKDKKGKNAMGGNLEGGLSKEAHYFVGGLLDHAKGFCAITNPLINSYKRLVSGYEAPTSITWALKNRSPLIRVPHFEKGHARIELRNPDPSCNPYLAFACVIEAGLDGIINKTKAPKMLTESAYRKEDIASLPVDLSIALEELKKDECIMKTLGPTVSEVFIAFKEKEWSSYKTIVSSWEVENYLLKY